MIESTIYKFIYLLNNEYEFYGGLLFDIVDAFLFSLGKDWDFRLFLIGVSIFFEL